MERVKTLLKNSVIFAIGNFGSRLILLVLVPFYTYYLSTTQYGTVDLITTTVSMLTPIVTLSIYEGTLRFVMDKDADNKIAILENSFILSIISILIFYSIGFLVYYFYKKIIFDYFGYLSIILILQSFQLILAQYSRGIGKIKVYAINGIVNSLVLAISNVFLIIFYGMGIHGYFCSIIISNAISLIFLIFTNFYDIKNFNKQMISLDIVGKMLKYSVPLIPNSFMWWLMNASSRYFILFFLGSSENGIFAVASKIPSIITMFQTIFFQAWQLSAIEEFDSGDTEIFYSNIFAFFSNFMILSTSIIFIFLEPVLSFLLSNEYVDTWKYVPGLLLGVVFSSFSSFYGTIYVASKKTNAIFSTTVIGGLLSVLFNFLLIPSIGLNGAGFSMALSFGVIWLIRVVDSKKIMNIRIHTKELVCQFVLLAIQLCLLYWSSWYFSIIPFILISIISITGFKKRISLFNN